MARRKARGPQFFAPNARAGAQWTESMLDSLTAFREEVTRSVVRRAVAAGAKVLYEEIKIRARGYEGQYGGPLERIMGDDGRPALSESIYYFWDKDQSINGKQVYLIGPKKSEVGHWFQVEYGHWRINEIVVTGDGVLIPFTVRLPARAWVPPRPYIRPAWDTKNQAALQAILAQMKESLAGINTVGFDA